MKKSKPKKIFFIIIIAILSIFILTILVSLFFPSDLKGNVALIPIKGVITVDGRTTFGQEATSSTTIIEFIEKADKNPFVKAIILDINSPGGSAVASDEIAQAIKKTNKTTLALIREIGASGAYWAASAADTIVANRMSITGSIGALSSYLEFSQLMKKYGVTYQRLVSGQYKDLGTPFKNLTSEERTLLQTKLNKIHEFFIQEIAQNRNLAPEKVRQIATGEFFLGLEAKELGLIDIIGDKKTAEQYLKEKLNIPKIDYITYEKRPTLWDLLFSVLSPQFYRLGQGIGSAFVDQPLGIRT